MEEQQKEIEAYEAEYNSRKEAAESANEPFDEEMREWDEISKPVPQYNEVKYVVCLDTMGQDCEITDDKKRFVLNTLKTFSSAWQESEYRSLNADCDRKIQ